MSAVSTSSQLCDFCNNEFPLDRTSCPHCSRPSLFPNVKLAALPKEKAKLQQSFIDALSDADARDCRTPVEAFRDACEQSQAVFRCDLSRLHHQVAGGTDIFAPYRDLERLRLRATPAEGLDFEKLRPQAEIELLGNEKHVGTIHYACLSIEGKGITRYGNCVVFLSEPMIAHRASCFQGNTAAIYFHKRSFADLLRAEWEDRHLICTAVMARKIQPATGGDEFAEILASDGASGEDDSFVEVHVFGDMTAKTFSEVRFEITTPSSRDRVYMQAVEEKLRTAGVSVAGA